MSPTVACRVGTCRNAVTSIVRLMDELAAALRRLDTEAPMTACQVWSPQLLDRCVQSSSKLMKHLHALQGAVYPPYLEMMGAREAEGGDLHVPASGVGAATVDSHDGVPSVAEGTLGKEEGMLPSDAEKSTEGGLSLVNGPDSHRSPVDQRRWAWERAKALEAEGRSPAEIAPRLNAAEGGRRWNHGSVLVLLRANISKVSAAY